MITIEEFKKMEHKILAETLEQNKCNGLQGADLVAASVSTMDAMIKIKNAIFGISTTEYCVICGNEIPEGNQVCGACERSGGIRMTARQREKCIFVKEHLEPLVMECDLSVVGVAYGITDAGEERCIIFRPGQRGKVVDITGSSFTKMALDVLNGIK